VKILRKRRLRVLDKWIIPAMIVVWLRCVAGLADALDRCGARSQIALASSANASATRRVGRTSIASS
jgi:hypothetical protein